MTPFFDDLETWGVPGSEPSERVVKIKDVNLSRLFTSLWDPSKPGDIDFSHMSYEGSLTSPPCDEGTSVFVAQDPTPIRY